MKANRMDSDDDVQEVSDEAPEMSDDVQELSEDKSEGKELLINQSELASGQKPMQINQPEPIIPPSPEMNFNNMELGLKPHLITTTSGMKT